MKQEIKMIFKQIKRSSVSFIIRELHSETILRYQFIPIRYLTLILGGDRHSHTLLLAVQNDTSPYGGAFGNVSPNHKCAYP